MNPIAEMLDHLTIQDPQTFGGLILFPLTAATVRAPDYRTLDEALERKIARVTEISEGGSVPELRFENLSDERILLVDGEELIGVRQNRVLNLTILVGARRQVVIPVSCVERGRWAYVSRQFRSSRRKLFAKARAAKAEQVSESLRSEGSRRSDQARIWADVAEVSALHRVRSATGSMADVYGQKRDHLAEYETAFQALADQSGAVFAINGRIVGLECFDAKETFERLLSKLATSYALDAIGATDQLAAAPSLDDVARFLKAIQIASTTTYPALGEGTDLRLEAPGLAGGALIEGDRVVHLAAFTIEETGES